MLSEVMRCKGMGRDGMGCYAVLMRCGCAMWLVLRSCYLMRSCDVVNWKMMCCKLLRAQATVIRLQNTKHEPVLQSTVPYYKIPHRTTKYYYRLQSTTPYFKVERSAGKYYKVPLRTTKYYPALQSTSPDYKVAHSA